MNATLLHLRVSCCWDAIVTALVAPYIYTHMDGFDPFVLCLTQMGGAYHGHLTSLIPLSPYKFWGRGGAGRPPHVHVVPCPDPYRCVCAWVRVCVGVGSSFQSQNKPSQPRSRIMRRRGFCGVWGRVRRFGGFLGRLLECQRQHRSLPVCHIENTLPPCV